MISFMAFLAVIAGEPIYREVKVPREQIGSFFPHVGGTKGYYKCSVYLNGSFTDRKARIYDKTSLRSKETCEELKKKFYKGMY